MKAQQMNLADILETIVVFSKMLKREEYFNSGLCFWVSRMLLEEEISPRQRTLAHEYIKSNKPSNFWDMSRIFNQPQNVYYWKEGDIKPRIKWLRKHVDILRKELEYRGL